MPEINSKRLSTKELCAISKNMLGLRYWFEHDSEPHEALLVSFAQNIVRFVSSHEFSLDQSIKASLHLICSGNNSSLEPVPLKVRSVRKVVGSYMVTATVQSHIALADEDRRNNKRYQVDRPGKYRRPGETRWGDCHVCDISSSGARIRPERPLKGESACEICIGPAPSRPLDKTIWAYMGVIWSRHLGHGIYEASGQYIRIEHIKDIEHAPELEFESIPGEG
jgi:hypothetical protein